ncbi:MAG: GNAT family N-acetyltransferase [Butyrivibrio sp.]|nr:GNAT family N-acetyltransferase [Butyrivibrio sp.]
MELSCVLIEDDNRGYFESVFSKVIELSDKRVAVAAVDENDFILGAVSYQSVGFEYVIDWLYVEPKVRRQGVGTFLVEQVLRAVVQSGEILPVTASFEFKEDDQLLHTFFLSCKHMTTSYSHERFYVSSGDIKSSDSLHKSLKTEHSIVHFFDRPESEQKKILNMLSRTQAYTVLDYDKWKEECVPELCQCVYVNNNLVDLIFMRKLSDGNLDLMYLYGKYPRGLIELLNTTVARMETLFPKASLIFDAMNEESDQLARHLFPRAKRAKVFEAEF